MANPRANIYPIQLQGAELNLNKYDSEIKQYSGFNKNNAPFVGGCLSNIFTKNENHSDEGKNVYIDKNGNFYKYDGVGLSKNGEYLFTVPEGTKNYNVEEVKVPEDVVYFNNPDCYVTCKKTDTGYTLKNHYPGEDEEIVTSINVEDVLTDVNFDNVCNIFVGCRRTNASVYVFVKLYLNTFGTWLGRLVFNKSIKGFCYCFSNEVTVLKEDDGITPYIFTLNNVNTFFNSTPNILLGEHTETHNLLIGLSLNEKHYDDNTNNDNIKIFNENVYLTQFSEAKSLQTNSTMYGDYFYIKNTAYCLCNEEINFMGIVQVISNIKIKFKLAATLNENGVFLDNTFEESCTLDVNVGSYIVMENLYYVPDIKYENIFIRSFGVQYTAFFTYAANTNRKMAFGICDFLTEAVTKVDDTTMSFETGGLMGDCVLTNNGIVTGITLPGGNILVSNWGSVDADSIFVSQGDSEYYTILYKDVTNNKWYRVYETEEKLLFVKNNQIVINANSIPNAYDLEEKKVKLFASGWNNRFEFCNECQTFEGFENKYLFASAINEQLLKDNASIILNPVPVINLNLYKFQGAMILRVITVPGIFENKKNNIVYVNFYFDLLTENKVTYKYSTNVKNIVGSSIKKNSYVTLLENVVKQGDNTFEGLPFPIDTNGNIQYSPSLFSEFFNAMGNDVFVKENSNVYQLMKSNNVSVMSFYLGTLTENLQTVFVLQGQYYGIINDNIYSFVYANGIVQNSLCVVNVQGLQFCGNTPYQAIFYSETNRCLYSFTGANILQQMQFVDKISEVYGYKYNPATQSIFLLTDIGVIVSSLFGIYQIDFANTREIFLLNNGVVVSDNQGNYKWIKYYNEDADAEYEKQNIVIETCFYGADNQTVTINDCLYMRLFCEEKTDGVVKVQATTISNEGKTTQKTQFNIKSSDWDKEENCIYLRYQPKQQRGLGISFKIDSPFKIASLSVGSTPDAILIDKVSKSAINGNSANSSIIEW